MGTNKKNKLVEIFAGSTIQAEMVKSLLEDSEIQAFLKDELMGTLAPWYTAPGGAGSVKVFVSNLDYDKARSVVEKYNNNLI